MKHITWTPDRLGVGERADHLLVLLLHDHGDTTQIPLDRLDAHRIGTELVAAAALSAAELASLAAGDATNGGITQ